MRELCKKTECETKAKGLSPHARDNQLHVGSSGDLIRPLVAEILIFYLHQPGGKITTPLFCAGGFLVKRRDRTTQWSNPRILFVLGLHKHLFVFVRVIQFVCGPRIMLCAHTNLVRDSIFSGGRPIFSISHSDFRPAKYTRKSTPRPIPSPRHPPPAGSPHQCDATLTTHPPSFPCPSSREEGVGKIYTRPL